jgi:hypothetical protein
MLLANVEACQYSEKEKDCATEADAEAETEFE